MKIIFKMLSFFSILLLIGAGCSGADGVKNTSTSPATAVVPASQNDVEEIVVDDTALVDNHHEGEEVVAPHGHVSSSTQNDHHAGEENVEPHGHDDNHHEDEENIEEHGHDGVESHDDTGLPPHRH